MKTLKFIAISGVTGVTENLYLYEYSEKGDGDLVVVDCGVGFPESEMYGVDLVIPDFTYIIRNRKMLRGIFITHGHEDHLGALPFLLEKVSAPIYCSKLVAGFIEDKLKDYNVKNFKINVVDPEKDTVSLGVFRITPFRVSHSVPDSLGLCLDTPEGKAFHVPDYKFDWTPVDGHKFDIKKASILASDGALLLASDSLGATTPGFTESEKGIEGRVETIVRGAKGRVFFTTISSNISRIKQALTVAERTGRKVAIVGRSTERKAAIAKELGYLDYPKKLVLPLKIAKRLPRNRILYIVSGSYGQPGSTLYRLALDDHDFIKTEPGDMVIFSGDPAPPGSKANVDAVVDRLIESEVDVHYYDLQEDLHVSGHGSQEDIKTLFSIINPEYLIPIGGTVRHNRAYKEIARSMGFGRDAVFELTSGSVVELARGQSRIIDELPVREILVDGLGIGDVGNVVLRDRRVLAKDGVAIVLLKVERGKGNLLETPEIISRGFVFEKKRKDFLQRTAKELSQELKQKGRVNVKFTRNYTIDFLENYFFKETGRRPMVLPVIVEV